MEAFDDWYDNIEEKYPLYQDKDGYNIGNIRALKGGWKAALGWVLNIFGANTFHGHPPIDVEKALKKELCKEE